MIEDCPFCGSSSTTLIQEENHPTKAYHYAYAVTCQECGAHGPWVSETGVGTSGAIDAWNEATALRRAVEALGEFLRSQDDIWLKVTMIGTRYQCELLLETPPRDRRARGNTLPESLIALGEKVSE